MTAAEPVGLATPPLVTRPFVILVLSGLCNFTAMGMVLPILPRFVEDDLGGGPVQVGIAVGAYSVSAALARPTLGRLGDRFGRRPLLLAGAVMAGGSVALYGLTASLALLVLFRLVTGLGEASFFVGAATGAQDMAPPHRRGEAASFFSLAVWGGMSIGPVLGEGLRSLGSTTTVWLCAGLVAGTGALVARLLPADLGRQAVVPTGPRRFLHPAAAVTGPILLLSMAGMIAFTAFLPLHLDDLGTSAGLVFLVHGAVVLCFRVFGARLPDRLGARRVVTGSMAATIAGCALLAVGSTVAVVYVGTVVFSFGNALLMPTLVSTTVATAPDAERGQAVASVTLAVDLAQGLGAPLLGVAVALTGRDAAAFVVAGALAAVALLLARRRLPAL